MQDSPHPLDRLQPEQLGSRLPDATGRRKRPKPGERRDQILQALASMLEQPGGERITTAALAARLDVSEAALYRHFASKAQMFEGLIEFIEQTLFRLVNHIVDIAEPPVTGANFAMGVQKAKRVVTVVIQFSEKNPGMARVMVGDALVFESERLQQRMNQLFDKLESTLKLCLRDATLAIDSGTPSADAVVCASLLTAFMSGRMQRYVRTGYRRSPSENLDLALTQMLG